MYLLLVLGIDIYKNIKLLSHIFSHVPSWLFKIVPSIWYS